jgi:signal transduction histidine kinase
MPEMDGYEVCRVLKSDEKLSGIPVIFISALGDTLDKVKAFEAGGVDYVTKPFQFQEVRARIETHLRLRRLQDELKEQNLQLEQTCKQLRELEVLRDNLTHMIVHDLRSPLSGVKGYLELIRAEEAKLSEEHRDYVGRALSSTSVLLKMIQDLLDVSRLEARKMPLEIRETDLGAVAHRASESLGALTRRHKVVLDLPQDPVVALCDPQVIERVVANLLGNALKFAPSDGEIQVTVAREPREARVSVRDSEEARVSVRDCGPGIPPEYHQRIFEKFGQVQMRDTDRGASAGLGLTFCKLAVEAHHGKIGVESNVGAGSTFWFTLPLA